MGVPSSQTIATWVKETLPSNWISLYEISVSSVRRHWTTISDTQLSELLEQNLPYIADHLRSEISECVIDGTPHPFEIDNEPVPYIRSLGDEYRPILLQLRRVNPTKFEEICAEVLKKLGADAKATQPTNDGGVDFQGTNLKIVPSEFGLPTACKAAVIGQAKRYQEGNSICETDLRAFVGAATLRRHELQIKGMIGPLTPVIFAFWTTSDFNRNAKQYARTLGIWYMDGRTLSNYVIDLDLMEYVNETARL